MVRTRVATQGLLVTPPPWPRDPAARGDVVGIFPDRGSIIRLIGAVLMEQTDEWTEQRRSVGTEILTKVDQAIAAPPSAADPPSLELPNTAMV